MHYTCENCGQLWPEEYVREWGRTRESDGMGSRPVCTALIPNVDAPPARNTDGRIVDDDQPMQVCGGQLERSEGEAGDKEAKKFRPTPITEGRRL